MHTVYKTPAVTATTRPTRDLDADLLVVPVVENDALSDEPDLDPASGGEYGAARRRGAFSGKAYEQLFTPLLADGWKARRALWVGVGPQDQVTTEQLRRVATIGALAARQRRFGSIAIVARSPFVRTERRAVQAIAEGAVLANYEGTSYKTSDEPTAWVDRVDIRVADEVDGTGVERGRVLGECSNMARELANEPGNDLTPPRVCRTRRTKIATRRGRRGRGARRETDRRAEDGPAARRGAWQPGAAASRGAAARAAERGAPAWCSGWSAKASRSIPAASRSSRPRTWTR